MQEEKRRLLKQHHDEQLAVSIQLGGERKRQAEMLKLRLAERQKKLKAHLQREEKEKKREEKERRGLISRAASAWKKGKSLASSSAGLSMGGAGSLGGMGEALSEEEVEARRAEKESKDRKDAEERASLFARLGSIEELVKTMSEGAAQYRGQAYVDEKDEKDPRFQPNASLVAPEPLDSRDMAPHVFVLYRFGRQLVDALHKAGEVAFCSSGVFFGSNFFPLFIHVLPWSVCRSDSLARPKPRRPAPAPAAGQAAAH